MTIISFAGIVTDEHSGAIYYNVSGPGVQAFNFGLNPAFGLNPKSYFVVVRLDLTQYPDFRPEGNGWYFSKDGTITITNATSQVNVFYRDFSDELLDENLPFYQSHPVVITAVGLVVAMVLVGVAVKVKTDRSERKP